MSQASRESSTSFVPGPQGNPSPTDAVAALKLEFEGFVDKLREKLDDLEITMQTQQQAAEDYTVTSSRNTFGEADIGTGSRSISRLFTIYDNDSILSKEVAKAQEPAALQEHRNKLQVKRDHTKYLPLGPVSSAQRQNELRLHNRWLQLSMQCDPFAAMSELRTNIRSASPTQYTTLRNTFESERTTPSDLRSRLHPNGAKRIAWDMLSSFVLVVDTVLLPIYLAWDWHKDTTDVASWINLGVFTFSLLFWTVDIMINLNTAVFQKGQLVFSRSEILLHYFRSWLLLDVALVGLDCVTVANVLLEGALADLSFSRFARIIRILRLLRLVKLAKVEGFIQEYAASTGRQWIVICAAIANSLFAFGLLIHVLACLWFWLGRTLAGEGQTSWIALAGAEQLSSFSQYLVSFRRVMLPIVPAPIDLSSQYEMLFDIGNNIVTMLALGVAVFKISATVLELRAMNEGRLKQQREIRRYLRSQHAPFELVARVLKFVEYKLERIQPNHYNTSLISITLQTELCVNQRSPYLLAMPICQLAKEVFPEAFASVCVALKRMVCENREEIFIAGSITNRMYVTVAGTYILQEGLHGDGEELELTGVHCLEEFSLYMVPRLWSSP
ncbi:Cnga4 [Symbiodinium natans]|uniref:Cnga4 protein n=1 Tax=Symbiodinium natans TaxID=878477 RepID=A0A812UA06_9DINO|nr:Cnga4 [Symbiodinium natans]